MDMINHAEKPIFVVCDLDSQMNEFAHKHGFEPRHVVRLNNMRQIAGMRRKMVYLLPSMKAWALTTSDIQELHARDFKIYSVSEGLYGVAPFPSPTGIEAEVCSDIAKRQQFGKQKYGVSVADNPLKLKAWLQHAYEESLDHSIYLKRAIRELEKEPS